jgi:hypothetical protein
MIEESFRHSVREWNLFFFVLKSNTICRGITSANVTESTTFITTSFKLIQRENIFMATEAKFLLNAPKQNLRPDNRLPTNVDSASPHRRLHHTLVCISAISLRCYLIYRRQSFISNLCNFGIRGWAAWNAEYYPTFRQTLQLPSSGWMCSSWGILEAWYRTSCR